MALVLEREGGEKKRLLRCMVQRMGVVATVG